MSNCRIIEFDILKGLGILFVILGHSVPDFPINLREDSLSLTIENLVCTFHMPLFFLCAGCMMQLSDTVGLVGGCFYIKK